MGVLRQVAVQTLMQGLQAQEISNRASGGGRAFGLPSQSRGVVREGADGAFSHLAGVGNHSMLSNGASELQIRVGNGAVGIVPTDHSLLDL